MEILNATTYTRDAVLRFQRFNARLFKSIPWSSYAMFAGFFAILIGGIVYSILYRRWINLGLLVLALLFIARKFYITFIGPARAFDKSSFKDLQHSYVFRKQGFSVIKGEEEVKRRYQDVIVMFDTPSALYLYFSRDQAFIVQKEGFAKITEVEQVKKRFIEAIGEKRTVTVKR